MRTVRPLVPIIAATAMLAGVPAPSEASPVLRLDGPSTIRADHAVPARVDTPAKRDARVLLFAAHRCARTYASAWSSGHVVFDGPARPKRHRVSIPVAALRPGRHRLCALRYHAASKRVTARDSLRFRFRRR